MQNLSRGNFGLIIAYLLPGLTALAGIALFSPTVRLWLGSPPTESPTVGGFLYVTLASLGVGLVVSTLRWAIVDTIHHRTGLPEPELNFASLQANLAAFEGAVENHYRHYQFLAGMFVATAFTFACVTLSRGADTLEPVVVVGFFALEGVFWMGSRDALKKYYERTAMLLRGNERAANSRERKPVSNSNDGKNGLRKSLKLEGPFR
jgi:hypothetical protein